MPAFRRSILVCALALLATLCTGFSSYRNKIPNGDNVWFRSELWSRVGHNANTGGDYSRNPFGAAFQSEGHTWTESLCLSDSDGDGRTNGYELGDPDCVWTEGAIPSRTVGITHPGFSDEGAPTHVPSSSPSQNPTFFVNTSDPDFESLQPTATPIFSPTSSPTGSPTTTEKSSFEALSTWFSQPGAPFLHAVLMIVAWLVVIPISILFPLLMKRKTGSTWFQLHRVGVVLGTFLSLGGFIAILDFNDYSLNLISTHGQVGLAINVLVILQVIFGILRPHKANTRNDDSCCSLRRAWELTHGLVGRTLLFVAGFNTYLGMNQYELFAGISPVADTARDVMLILSVSFVGFTLIVWLCKFGLQARIEHEQEV
mmetsp:Transcript_19527/g.36092  ORF Transcript_19527/g.36092 Transcript_19527/m.36092 type:complete len:371 (-) Transcript_19527:49-1161(-)